MSLGASFTSFPLALALFFLLEGTEVIEDILAGPDDDAMEGVVVGRIELGIGDGGLVNRHNPMSGFISPSFIQDQRKMVRVTVQYI